MAVNGVCGGGGGLTKTNRTRNERTIEWITRALHDTTESLDESLKHVIIDRLVNNLNRSNQPSVHWQLVQSHENLAPAIFNHATLDRVGTSCHHVCACLPVRLPVTSQ